MLRFLLGLIITIFLITLIRAIIGLVGRAVAQLFEPDAGRSRPRAPSGGELVQDPVCGIYVSNQTKVRKTVKGKTYYFCSEACRDKFQG